MTYKFATQSDEHGREWYTDYATKEEAAMAQDRIKRKATLLADGILRFYTDIYPEDAQFDEEFDVEAEFYGTLPEEE